MPAQKPGVALNPLLSRKHYAVKALRKKLKSLYADMAAVSQIKSQQKFIHCL
jgi:hypothetical protein